MLAYNSPTDRMMARVAITIFALGALYGVYSFGQPVYWRLYATVLRPFDDPGMKMASLKDDPFASVLAGGGGKHHATTISPHELGAQETTTQTTAVVQLSPPPSPPFPPPPPAEVNLDSYPLTKERITPMLQDGYIMVTWANEHYLDFARSWVASLKKVGVTGYIVGAMDDDMLRALVHEGINTWRMNTGITKKDLGWGSPNFHKMGRQKISLIKQFVAFDGMTLVISDIDTVWMRNPIPFFAKYPDADILTSTDELHPSVATEDLENWPRAGSAFNIGIMMFRPKSREFVDEWIKMLEKPDVWDQNAFNDLARRGAKHSEGNGLFKGYDGKITVGILPASQFASGHVFFVQRKYEEFGLKPYVAHATFQYSGTPGKRNRFREFMLFEDPPSYYDHPKGFITYKNDIPPHLLANATGTHSTGALTPEKMTSHFNLVNHQLIRLRGAIALAMLTGRVLVMPPIWCELDKYWAPLLNGNIPGSVFKKPFICPMDHVLDIEGGWFPKKPEDHFGPHVEWREYTFLQNPRLSAAVNNSRMTVEVCPKGTAGCSDGSSAPAVQDGKIRIQEGLDSSKLEVALSKLEAYKILDFDNMAKLWPEFKQEGGWFTDSKKHSQLVERMRMMPSVSCCLQTQPGWVWYDLMWDVPHTDRFNRKFESWHIKRGDQERTRHRSLLHMVDSPSSLSEIASMS